VDTTNAHQQTHVWSKWIVSVSISSFFRRVGTLTTTKDTHLCWTWQTVRTETWSTQPGRVWSRCFVSPAISYLLLQSKTGVITDHPPLFLFSPILCNTILLNTVHIGDWYRDFPLRPVFCRNPSVVSRSRQRHTHPKMMWPWATSNTARRSNARCLFLHNLSSDQVTGVLERFVLT
jgi:hypothetical protein